MEQISYKIIEHLQKQDNHVRELAKQLNTNHMTILRKINQLEKENVLDYKQEGKNKVYFLKKSIEAQQYTKMLEHYKLIQLIREHPRIRSIVEKIQTTNINMAIIFGSYARGNETKESDIDIYINTNNKKIKENIQLIDSKLSIKIGKFDKENLLIKEIIKNHIIIKGVETYYEHIY